MGNLEVLIKVLAQSLPSIYVGLGRRRGLQGNAMVWWGVIYGHESGVGMGFSDLHEYSQALLTKRARRIVHDPLSLPGQNFEGVTD